MKALLTLLGIFIFSITVAQPPQAIQYQAVARDVNGNTIGSQFISLRFTIHDATSNGTVLYRELQSVMTNPLGSFSVSIGQGMVLNGVFSSINWGVNSKFLETEMDPAGGNSFVAMGTQQMLSVPYSFYAGSAGGFAGGDLTGTYPNPVVSRINGALLGTTTGATTGQVLKWNGVQWAPGSDNGSSGTVTSITAGTGLSGGTITTTGTINMPNTGTAGTYGSSSLIPVITTDAQGRVSNVSTQSVSSGWSLTGNNNTVDGTSYFGTTNPVALSFKVNDQKSGRIDFTNNNNTFFGYQDGNSITTGINNVAFGHNALSSASIANTNTALGKSALQTNVAVDGNTAIGYQSQMNTNNSTSSTSGLNTSVGYLSLRGSFVLSDNTGTSNTAIGNGSMANNKKGSNNVALGTNTIVVNDSGMNNTAIGWVSMQSSIGGSFNTALGSTSLYSMTGGNYNTAIGVISQRNGNSTGDGFNTSIGASSLLGSNTIANNTGINNTALGGAAMLSNSSGTSNTAAGFQTMAGNTTGNNNCGFGLNALISNSTGNSNTAVGDNAGASFNQGSFNTYIGSNTNATGSNLTNSTAIGYNTTVSASNQIRVGNGVLTIGGPVDWAVYSDRRLKTNIRNDVQGLSFIMRLKPVTYNKDYNQEQLLTGNELKQLPDPMYGDIRYTGFIAQDVEAAAKEIGFDFSGVDAPKNEKDIYGLRYATFVVPLVKAVQEQQALIEELRKEVDELKQQANKSK
jgi:hypothetical protein